MAEFFNSSKKIAQSLEINSALKTW